VRRTPVGPEEGERREMLAQEVDRKEFFKRAARLAATVALAGSLGAVIGCANETAQTQPADTSTRQQDEGSSNAQVPSQGTSPSTSNASRCQFYRDGTCARTGQACTDCIDR
jgi:hypothetical protein